MLKVDLETEYMTRSHYRRFRHQRARYVEGLGFLEREGDAHVY